MLEQVFTSENMIFVAELIFWPALWTVTYVCVVALLVAAVQHFYKRAGYGDQTRLSAAGGGIRRGALLMFSGALGLAACAAVWEVLFGDIGRAATLLLAHIHGTQDWRETILLVVSTISVLAADIGSVIFLDNLPN